MKQELTREQEIQNLMEKWRNAPTHFPIRPEELVDENEGGIETDTYVVQMQIDNVGALAANEKERKQIIEEALDTYIGNGLDGESDRIAQQAEYLEFLQESANRNGLYDYRNNIIEQLIDLNALDTCLELIKGIAETEEKTEHKKALIVYAIETKPISYREMLKNRVPHIFKSTINRVWAYLELPDEETEASEYERIRKNITEGVNRELGIDDEELRKKHAILREYVEYSIKLWKNSDEAKDRRRAREIAMEIDEPEPRFRAIFSLASQTGIPQTYITAFKIAESMEDRREQLECVSNLNTTLSIAAHREKYANVPNYILNCVAVPPEGIQLILAKLTLINKKWAEVLKDKIHE